LVVPRQFGVQVSKQSVQGRLWGGPKQHGQTDPEDQDGSPDQPRSVAHPEHLGAQMKNRKWQIRPRLNFEL
jgi:hypothetical protein